MTAVEVAAEVREILVMVDHRGGQRHVSPDVFRDRLIVLAGAARTIDPASAEIADGLLACLAGTPRGKL